VIAFLDRKGRTWAGRLDVDAAVRLRDLAGLDVMAAAVDRDTRDMLAGPTPEATETVAAGLYWLFRPQAERLGVTPKAFYRGLRALDGGELRETLFEAIAAFFRMPGPPAKASGDEPEPKAAELWRDLYRLAGEAGVPPGPHTFGELAAMADGRRRAEWGRTAHLRADIVNAAPFRRGAAVKPEELDPTGGLKDSGRAKGERVIKPGNLVSVFSALIKATRRHGE
jgi:hypothetical protein